jgi:hypothetical protein
LPLAVAFERGVRDRLTGHDVSVPGAKPGPVTEVTIVGDAVGEADPAEIVEMECRRDTQPRRGHGTQLVRQPEVGLLPREPRRRLLGPLPPTELVGDLGLREDRERRRHGVCRTHVGLPSVRIYPDSAARHPSGVAPRPAEYLGAGRGPARGEGKESPIFLREAFHQDHRVLVRDLKALREALLSRDVGEATRLADELDRAVGPHMQFEEEVFYPTLEKVLGRKFVDNLYDEHAEGQAAVRALGARPEGEPFRREERDRLLVQVELALNHALSCGTLTSHLAALSPEVRSEMLVQLLEIRARGGRWTELHTVREK